MANVRTWAIGGHAAQSASTYAASSGVSVSGSALSNYAARRGDGSTGARTTDSCSIRPVRKWARPSRAPCSSRRRSASVPIWWLLHPNRARPAPRVIAASQRVLATTVIPLVSTARCERWSSHGASSSGVVSRSISEVRAAAQFTPPLFHQKCGRADLTAPLTACALAVPVAAPASITWSANNITGHHMERRTSLAGSPATVAMYAVKQNSQLCADRS